MEQTSMFLRTCYSCMRASQWYRKYALAFAARYPHTINAQAQDIRKSNTVDCLDAATTKERGPVIVKTDLNHAGIPERSSGKLFSRALWIRPVGFTYRVIRWSYQRMLKLLTPHPPIRKKGNYHIYPSLQEVPAVYRKAPYVIQKFQSEMQGKHYILREYYFFNQFSILNVEKDMSPVINTRGGTCFLYIGLR